MRVLLNAGFGHPLGRETLALILSLGFDGVRQDVPFFRTEAEIENLLSEFIGSGLSPILLVGGGDMSRDGRPAGHDEVAGYAWRVATVARRLGLFDGDAPAAIELGNEPDIAPGWEGRPDWFALLLHTGYVAVKTAAPSAIVISGGVSATSREALRYLDQALSLGDVPQGVAIGYHAYRTTRPPHEPLDGFGSREAEIDELGRVARGRALWCTEAGWHTARSCVRSGFLGICRQYVRYSDAQVLEFTRVEMALQAALGAEGFVLYQLNDGIADIPEHRFGIRYRNGDLKPVSRAPRLFREPPEFEF